MDEDYLMRNLHPHMKSSLSSFKENNRINPEEFKEITTNILRNDLKKKCLILNSNKFIIKSKGYSQIEVLDIKTKGNQINIVTFPGFIVDFMQDSNGIIVILGFNNKGNYVCRFTERQFKRVKLIYASEVIQLDDSSFLHRVHDLEDNLFLDNNLFHYSFQSYE